MFRIYYLPCLALPVDNYERKIIENNKQQQMVSLNKLRR